MHHNRVFHSFPMVLMIFYWYFCRPHSIYIESITTWKRCLNSIRLAALNCSISRKYTYLQKIKNNSSSIYIIIILTLTHVSYKSTEYNKNQIFNLDKSSRCYFRTVIWFNFKLMKAMIDIITFTELLFM
jgi:hypothetical protein